MTLSSSKPPTHPSSSNSSLAANNAAAPSSSPPDSTAFPPSTAEPPPDPTSPVLHSAHPRYGAIRSSSSHPDFHPFAPSPPASSPSAAANGPKITASYSSSSLVHPNGGGALVNRIRSNTALFSSFSSTSLPSSLPLPQGGFMSPSASTANSTLFPNSPPPPPSSYQQQQQQQAAARTNPHTIAASTSFFGIPLSFSSLNIRASPSTHSYLAQARHDDVDWLSLYVVYVVTLVAEAARGLMLPSTWPYFQSLGGRKASLGFFVASFSLGRMFSTIPLGYLSDSYSISMVLTFASICQVVGHVLYALSPSLPVLYASRSVVGFGSATMSVCRAHLTRAIPPRQRTHHFAYLSGLQFIGFAVLPGLGGLMAKLPAVRVTAAVVLNGFTYPAYFLALVNAACVLLIHRYYLDPPPVQPRIPSIRSASLQRLSALAEQTHQNQPDVLALVVCLLLNVVFRGVIAEFETISVPFLMEQYRMPFDVSSFYLSLVGLLGLVVYMSFKPISARFSDRSLVFAGLSFIAAGCLPLAFQPVASRLPAPLYIGALGLTWSLAFPLGQTAVLALFSKILYGLPAGGLLGIFSASGSVARIFMAILASEVWRDGGREAVFVVIIAYTTVALILAGVCYSRLKPRSMPIYLSSSSPVVTQRHRQ